jgi:hypothetical protein
MHCFPATSVTQAAAARSHLVLKVRYSTGGCHARTTGLSLAQRSLAHLPALVHQLRILKTLWLWVLHHLKRPILPERSVMRFDLLFSILAFSQIR